MSSATQTPPALPSLYDFFAPGGVLSRSPLPYEFRRGQLEMAQAVERALKAEPEMSTFRRGGIGIKQVVEIVRQGWFAMHGYGMGRFGRSSCGPRAWPT